MGRFDKEIVTRNGAPVVERPQSAPVQQMGFNNTIMTPAVAREVATALAQVANAKMNPRCMPDVYNRLDTACAGVKLANTSMYAYARGGTDIHGPSIRLAEAVARAFGNIKYGFEVTDSDEMTNTVRAYAFDMESNSQAERIFKVQNIRHTQAGDKVLTDPRDIYENVANNASRRVRACILEIIPPDVIDYAMDMCDKTRAAHCDISKENIANMLKGFEHFGVSKTMIEAFIQRKVDAITEVQYLRLKEIFQSLNDGIAKPSDFFQVEAPAKAPEPKAEPIPETTPSADGPENFEDAEDF